MPTATETTTADQAAADAAARVREGLEETASAAGAAAGASAAADLVAERLAGEADSHTGRQIAAQVAERLATLEDDAADVRSMVAAMAAEIARPAPAAPEAARRPLAAMMDAHAHNPAALGAALDGQFADFGEFVKATLSMVGRKMTDPRLRMVSESGHIRADLTGEEIELGGALLPEEFRAQLMSLTLQPTSIRSMATVLPMGSSTLTVPSIRDESHADGSVYGGVKCFWTESGGEIQESEPEFAQSTLTAKGLLGLTTLNNTLISDSAVTVGPLLARMFADAIRWAEEDKFLNGSGAGVPQGIATADATIDVDRVSGGDQLQVEDFEALEGRLLPECDMHAVYMASPGARPSIMRIMRETDENFDPRARSRYTFNGRSIIVTEHCPRLGQPGDLMLVDWRFYLIGDRQAVSMSSSEHSRFSRNQTQMRTVCRLDGQPWLSTPLTPANGGDTLSPFVRLTGTN